MSTNSANVMQITVFFAAAFAIVDGPAMGDEISSVFRQTATTASSIAQPTDSFGFAGVSGFNADDILRGTIEWSDSQREARFLTVSDLAMKNGHIEFTIAVGKRVAKITVPAPKSK